MEIKLIKGTAILIKGKKESVLVNPEPEMLPKINTRLVIYNRANYAELRTVGERVSIMGPGEYEIGGVEVNGFNGGDGNTVYTVFADGVMVGILGKLKEELSEKKSGKISGVDVLIVDVENEQTVGSKYVLKLAKSWGANYIIPIGNNQEEITKFLDVADDEGLEPVESLKIDKDNLPDGTEIVLLKEGN